MPKFMKTAKMMRMTMDIDAKIAIVIGFVMSMLIGWIVSVNDAKYQTICTISTPSKVYKDVNANSFFHRSNNALEFTYQGATVKVTSYDQQCVRYEIKP